MREGEDRVPTPLKPGDTILQEEIAQALQELRRPARGLFLSGLIAGFSIGIGVLLMATLITLGADEFSAPTLRLLLANAYAVGFIIVVLGHTDLFTEYTTIALLPALSGDAGIPAVARLWGIVYVSNLLAAAAFAVLAVHLASALKLAEPAAFGLIGHELTRHSGGAILLSGLLAGWLMGLMSWLVSAARETISQIFVVWLIAFAIGFLGLHHVVTGTVEVLAAVYAGGNVSWTAYWRFLAWATLGNVLGGLIFAVLIRYSVMVGGRRRGGQR